MHIKVIYKIKGNLKTKQNYKNRQRSVVSMHDIWIMWHKTLTNKSCTAIGFWDYAIDVWRKLKRWVRLKRWVNIFGWGAGSPSNTVWLWPRPISVPSFILINPTDWPQYTNVTDRQTERSDSIGRTVLQMVAQKLNRLVAAVLQPAETHINCALTTVVLKYENIFSERIIRVWNSLPPIIVSFESLSTFSKSLGNVNLGIHTK